MRSCLILFVVFVGVGSSGCGERASDSAPDAAAQSDASSLAAKAKAREEVAVAREAERLAALWSYVEVPVGKGRQLSAAINSTNDVDTDGQGPKAVQLVFRDHPSWGRSSYLVLKAGDFDCYGGCTVNVTVDDAAPTSMAARRPRTDDAIAMFINDAKALWRLISGGKRVSIEFPVKMSGTRTASFDVAGLDRSKMPGWGPARAPNRIGGNR